MVGVVESWGRGYFRSEIDLADSPSCLTNFKRRVRSWRSLGVCDGVASVLRAYSIWLAACFAQDAASKTRFAIASLWNVFTRQPVRVSQPDKAAVHYSERNIAPMKALSSAILQSPRLPERWPHSRIRLEASRRSSSCGPLLPSHYQRSQDSKTKSFSVWCSLALYLGFGDGLDFELAPDCIPQRFIESNFIYGG